MSKLLNKVDQGEQVVFGARGKAQYKITKVPEKRIDRAHAFGAWSDKVSVANDAFSKATDELVAKALLGES